MEHFYLKKIRTILVFTLLAVFCSHTVAMNSRNTLLVKAIEQKYTTPQEKFEHIKKLLEADHCPATLNATDCDGQTALSLVVDALDLDLVNLLLSYKNNGLNIWHVSSISKRTPLIIAANNCRIKRALQLATAKALLNADPKSEKIDLQDYLGRTALHWAIIEKHPEMVELLLIHGANISVQDTNHKTPLDYVGWLSNDPTDRIKDGIILIKCMKTAEKNTAIFSKILRKSSELLPFYPDDQFAKDSFHDMYSRIKMAIEQSRSSYANQLFLNAVLLLEHNDYNNAITRDFVEALYHDVTIVCSAALLHTIVTSAKRDIRIPSLEMLTSGLWSVFQNKDQDIVIIVPQKEAAVAGWLNHYRLNNLELVQQHDIAKIFSCPDFNKKPVNLKNLVTIFPLKVKKQSAQTQESPEISFRWYMAGHGGLDNTIASIPVNTCSSGSMIGKLNLTDLQFFLWFLSAINTEFIYISSCYAGGLTTDTMQRQINDAIQATWGQDLLHEHLAISHKKLACTDNYSTQELDHFLLTAPLANNDFSMSHPPYPIVMQATTDEMTLVGGTENLSEFFNMLDKYLKYCKSPCKTSMPTPVSVSEAVQQLYKAYPHISRLPSIRLQGVNSFFRAIPVDDMNIVTQHALATSKAGNSLIPALENTLKHILEKEKKELRTLQLKSTAIDQQIDLHEKLSLSAECPFNALSTERLLQERFMTETAINTLQTRNEKNCVKVAELKAKQAKKLISIEPSAHNTYEYNISSKSKYVLIYPVDLTDITFDIAGDKWPRFISKIGGRACHFIKKICIQTEPFETLFDDQLLLKFIRQSFVAPFTDPCESVKTYGFGQEKSWFIKELVIQTDSGVRIFGDILIQVISHYDNMDCTIDLYYKDHSSNITHVQSQYCNKAVCERISLEPAQFNHDLKTIFYRILIAPDSCTNAHCLFQATAGQENYVTLINCLNWFMDGLIPATIGLYIAVNNENFEEFTKILATQSDNIDFTSAHGIYKPLLSATTYKKFKDKRVQTAMTQLILNVDSRPEHLNVRGLLNRTPLHNAIVNGNEEIVKILLTYKNSGLDLACKDALSHTPLHYAIKHGQTAIARAIVQADPTSSNLNAQSRTAGTALNAAVISKNVDIVRLLLSYKDHGLDLTLKNKDNRTPYEEAVSLPESAEKDAIVELFRSAALKTTK